MTRTMHDPNRAGRGGDQATGSAAAAGAMSSTVWPACSTIATPAHTRARAWVKGIRRGRTDVLIPRVRISGQLTCMGLHVRSAGCSSSMDDGLCAVQHVCACMH